MSDSQQDRMLRELAEGRTELVFDLLEAGCSADYKDENGVSLIQHCAYYGDVSAIRLLLAHGESLTSMGENLGLNTASYHGHWRLCQFLLERGAKVDLAEVGTGETSLHNALAKTDRVVYDRVLRVLLKHGANPNIATKYGVETGAFMRDCRTKGETPLHRAAAFGEVETIPDADCCRGHYRCERWEWRNAAIVGELVWPANSGAAGTTVWKVSHSSAEPEYAGESAG